MMLLLLHETATPHIHAGGTSWSPVEIAVSAAAALALVYVLVRAMRAFDSQRPA